MGADFKALALVVAAGALLIVAGCDKHGGRTPCPAGKLCFEAGNDADPTTLDPPRTELTTEANVIDDMLIGLMTLDAASKPIPGMATSWTTSPDGLVWTFHLRDAVWSDGVPVTAGDFVFGFRRLEDPRTASDYAYLFYLIKGAEAVNTGKAAPETLGVAAPDPRTVRITLTHPAPYLLQMLTHQISFPIPEHAVKRWGDAWVQPGHYVSNGPYTLASFKLGDRVVLNKNPRFYDAANVCFDRVSYYPTPDVVSAERRLRAGEFDLVIGFTSSRARFLRRPDQIPTYVHTSPWLGLTYLTFNTHVPALADKRVRLALSMSVDRDFIAGKLLGAGQPPQYGFVPVGTANYTPIPNPAWASWPLARRQAAARRLLADSGYTPAHPLKIGLKYPNGGDFTLIPPALQSDWRAIGVRTSLSPVESQIFYQDMNVRDSQVGLAAWIADFNDPLTFLGLFRSNAGTQNYGDYKNPAYDDLLTRADDQTDLKARAALLEQAERLPMDDVNAAPIYGYATRDLLDPNVTGWVDNLPGFHMKRWMCFKDAAARRAANR